ncbi:MAG: NACHT domain-containing protein, partial [Myxococcota bacterium]
VHESGVLLVGDPGAGKTTLLRYLQYELSAEDLESGRQRVIFLLELRTYRRRQQLELRDWFEAAFIRACAELGGLKDRLASGDVWLLLDGLNEMPYGANARARFDDLRDVLIDLPAGNRVIVSCRSQDVEGSLGRVRRAEIKPLSEDAVSKFLAKYAPDKAEVALKELRKHKLLELYQNPGDLGAGGAPRR